MKKSYNWLDKYIEEQKVNRPAVNFLNKTQEIAERENWDRPRKRKR